MERRPTQLGRRAALAAIATGAAALGGARPTDAAQPLLRPVPFDGRAVARDRHGLVDHVQRRRDEERRAQRMEVLRAFFAAGGTVIDSSPMYGSSEEVIGWGLARLGDGRCSRPPRSGPRWRCWAGADEPARASCGASSGSISCRSTTCWPGGGISRPCWRTRSGTGEVLRPDHLARPASRGLRGRDGRAAARRVQFSYSVADREAERGSCRSRPNGDGGADQPAVRRRPLVPCGRGQAAAGLGRGDRLRQLGPVLPQIRDLAPGGHLRDPGHLAGRAHGREHGRVVRAVARPGPARAMARRVRSCTRRCCPSTWHPVRPWRAIIGVLPARCSWPPWRPPRPFLAALRPPPLPAGAVPRLLAAWLGWVSAVWHPGLRGDQLHRARLRGPVSSFRADPGLGRAAGPTEFRFRPIPWRERPALSALTRSRLSDRRPPERRPGRRPSRPSAPARPRC